MKTTYLEDAQSSALSMMVEYLPAIVEGARRDGVISDDINARMYGSGRWHQETHYPSYSFRNARVVLDQLSDHIETDKGLWQGQEPEDAICTKASYTYANAVSHYFSEEVEKLNELLDIWVDEHEDADAIHEAVARCYVKIKSRFHCLPLDEDGLVGQQAAEGAKAALKALETQDWLVVEEFLEYVKENDYHAWLHRDLTPCVKAAQQQRESDE